MRARWIGLAAGLGAATAFAASIVALGQGGDAISSAYARNGSLSSYTFTLDARMAMRSFPWLHFSFVGQGTYERGVATTSTSLDCRFLRAVSIASI